MWLRAFECVSVCGSVSVPLLAVIILVCVVFSLPGNAGVQPALWSGEQLSSLYDSQGKGKHNFNIVFICLSAWFHKSPWRPKENNSPVIPLCLHKEADFFLATFKKEISSMFTTYTPQLVKSRQNHLLALYEMLDNVALPLWLTILTWPTFKGTNLTYCVMLHDVNYIINYIMLYIYKHIIFRWMIPLRTRQRSWGCVA